MLKDTGPSGETYAPCPDDVRTQIEQMGVIMCDPRYNHAGTPAQLAVELMKKGTAQSFAEVEKWFRDAHSQSHLIAVPLDYFGPQWEGKTRDPLGRPTQPEYTLWVGVNGAEEAADMLAALGVSPENNMLNLTKTGVLSVD